jgi:hypothetical protein
MLSDEKAPALANRVSHPLPVPGRLSPAREERRLEQNHSWRVSKPLPPSGSFIKEIHPQSQNHRNERSSVIPEFVFVRQQGLGQFKAHREDS